MPRPAPILAQKTAARLLTDLGAQIRRQRETLGISQQDAADAAGMSRPTFGRIENGSPSVTIGSFVTAASVLGLELTLGPSAGSAEEAAEIALPETIELDRYPSLQRAAWHIPGEKSVTPADAFEIYERSWRHIDRDELSDSERLLVKKLSEKFGRGRQLV